MRPRRQQHNWPQMNTDEHRLRRTGFSACGTTCDLGNLPKSRTETKDLGVVFWANRPKPAFYTGVLSAFIGVHRRPNVFSEVQA